MDDESIGGTLQKNQCLCSHMGTKISHLLLADIVLSGETKKYIGVMFECFQVQSPNIRSTL